MHHFVLWSFVAVLAPLFVLAGAKFLIGMMIAPHHPIEQPTHAAKPKGLGSSR
ncbi:MAG: hypothetical protein JWN86_818 [Planctomycetota bacterium]|nr:hypothetical protein [Planctomycetota bacterium]